MRIVSRNIILPLIPSQEEEVVEEEIEDLDTKTLEEKNTSHKSPPKSDLWIIDWQDEEKSFTQLCH